MHVDDIMKNYNPVYPENGTWEDTFKILREDQHEFAIVQELVSDLDKYGGFRDPIILSNYEQWLKSEEAYEYDEDEERDVYVPQVTDGTHRVFAHYLSEHKEAKVQHGWKEGDDLNTTEDWYPLAVTLLIAPDIISDQMWEVFDRYRSFKLTEEVWVTSDLMSSQGKALSLYWDTGVHDEDKLQSLIPLIDAHLIAVADEIGLKVIPVTGVVRSEEEDDAFFGRVAAKTD